MAIAIGYRKASDVLSPLAISQAMKTTLSAIAASTGGVGILTRSRTESASVTECATVKPVIVTRSRRGVRAMKTRHATNSK